MNIGNDHIWTTSHLRYEIDHLATRRYLPLPLNSLISSCMVEHYLIFFLNKFIYYDVDGTFCLLATIVSLLFSFNSESFLQKLYIPSNINTDMTNRKALRYTALSYMVLRCADLKLKRRFSLVLNFKKVTLKILYTRNLISVRLWNLKDGGS